MVVVEWSYYYMSGWFTPAFLFLFINLVIGVVAISSRWQHQQPHPAHEDGGPRALSRGASILERLRSFNLNHYRYGHEDVPMETISSEKRVINTNDNEFVEEEEEVVVETLEDAYKNFKRSQSDSTTAQGRTTIGGGGGRELRKAETEKPKPKVKVEEDGEKEVDARADDFINRFRKQLQLQRLESLLRNRKEG